MEREHEPDRRPRMGIAGRRAPGPGARRLSAGSATLQPVLFPEDRELRRPAAIRVLVAPGEAYWTRHAAFEVRRASLRAGDRAPRRRRSPFGLGAAHQRPLPSPARARGGGPGAPP